MTLLHEVRLSLRSLIRSPGFTLLAVITLAIGIGVSTAIWSIVDAVLLQPLPYPDSDRLVQIQATNPDRGAAGYPMSALDFRDYQEKNHSFEVVAATFRENLNLTDGATPERVSGAWVSASFFEVFGTEPQLGRSFRSTEDAPGGDLVAVISNNLWQRRFSGDPKVIGSTVAVNGRKHTLVGVAPAGFNLPDDVEIWLPIAIDWQEEARNHGWVVPFGRVRRDLDVSAARADLERIASYLQTEHPDTNGSRWVKLVPLKEVIVGDIKPAIAVLVAGAFSVMLIAAANASILLLLRSIVRRRELAIRQALGARRHHLACLLMIESTVLALAGGAVGLLLAHWCTNLLRVKFAELIPRAEGIAVNPSVFCFALVVSAITGLVVGAIPALRTREDRISTQLKNAGRASSGRSSAPGGALVAIEIALAIVLLVGAALLVRTFLNLVNVEPGFDSQGVVTAEISLTDEKYTLAADRVALLRNVIDDLAAQGEVEAVGSVYPLPLFGRRVTTSAWVEGAPPEDKATRPLVELRFVSPGYLEAAGLTLVAGRFINDSDTAEAPSSVVVNEAFVRHLAPQGDAVGRRCSGYDPGDPALEWDTIVGVVQDVRYLDLSSESGPEMYIPVDQEAFEWATFVVRARPGRQAGLTNLIRSTIHRHDPELPVFNEMPLHTVVARSLTEERFVTTLLVLFSASALALASFGVFSVVSYSVGRRVREIAIRQALGATRSSVLGLVYRQGLIPVAIGLITGSAIALAMSRTLSSRLFGVVAHDPAVYVGALLLVCAVTAISTWFPARRAARVELSTVLDSE